MSRARRAVDVPVSIRERQTLSPVEHSAKAENAWHYQALFAGAAGHTYGHISVWDFFSPGRPANTAYDRLLSKLSRPAWQQALNAPAAGRMHHAKHLMLSRPYFLRIPDQSLIVGDAGEGSAHIGATRGHDGSYAMVYIPDSRPISVDMTRLAGERATAWWFDPRTGDASRIDKIMLMNQTQSFVPPTSGVDQDWVLVIDDAAAHFPKPGAR